MGLFRRKPTVDPAELAAVVAEVAELRETLVVIGRRLDSTELDRRQVADLVVALQQRVASIGTELTNQLTELSGEIDTLHARPDPAVAIVAVDGLRTHVDGVNESIDGLRGDVGGLQSSIDELATGVKSVEDDADGLRTSQERLANEQARYQIAFREDLAAIADKVNRKRS